MEKEFKEAEKKKREEAMKAQPEEAFVKKKPRKD